MTEPENTTPPQPTKDEIVREIAKAISDRRKLRNLTLEKVFQNIKIRIPYLQAIENGRWDQLPAEVYVRSFIKRYADHLGMDGEKLLAPYFDLNKAPEKKAVPQILKGSEITRVQVIGMALAGIIVIVLIKLIVQEKPAAPSNPSGSAQVASSTASPTGLISASTLPLNPETHLLEVYSPNPLWLRVTAKDKNFEGFIPQSATWTWRGEGAFSIRLGHTQDVSVHFDKKPVAIEDNQKKIEIPSI